MNNLSATILLICLSIFAELPAQTLKNIYRHNLPVLRIPAALIDKVKTVDVDGVKNLQIIPFFGETIQIPFSEIDSITHYTGAVNAEQLGEMRTASVMGVVRGPTGAPEMNAIVSSPFGGEETRTDPNGVFFLNNILVYDKLGYITITKPGFYQGSRSFLPLETGSNRINVQLLSMTQSGTFSATSGGTVISGLLQLTFPANAIQLNGQPYTGAVNVYAAALDPTSPTMFDQMPGELLGGMNDSLRLLRSFGMASIELRDSNMNELQLENGLSATLKFNIPTALQAEAPQTIDWWSFDETLGYWKHEGEAQKQGTNYIGAASHFSWWNCDVPQNFNDFHGSVNTAGGIPVSDAQIIVISPTMGTGTIYTNAEGIFTCRVPKNQSLTLNVNLTCSTTNDWSLAHSETISSSTQPITSTITASLNGRFPIIGTVVNCAGQPVESGYVRMGSQIFITENGNFTIQTCQIGTYSIRGFNIINLDSIKVSEIISLLVESSGTNTGNVQTCSIMFGAVTDIDGNIYQTVLIGDQWWMAENLKTSHFADGTLIPNIPNTAAWVQLSTPAWCNYNNSSFNDTLFGKLYNWFTVADVRNVCPIGWHVPSDSEWNTLIGFLDPLYNPNISGLQSEIAGIKMKAGLSWETSDFGASNESGFSGLAGGSRSYNQGDFLSIGAGGYWWSSTVSTVTTRAWIRDLLSFLPGPVRIDFDKPQGVSIRCILN
jgi:uncharacterized protein (TIGR02145 family)